MSASASFSLPLRTLVTRRHERRFGGVMRAIYGLSIAAACSIGVQMAAGQPVTLGSPSLELLAAMPPEVTAIAGADDASAIITAARAMPLLNIARRFGYLTATESAWGKLEEKLALRGTGHRVLLHGPLVIGMAKDGADGFVMITGLSADAAALLRSKLEAVPTELVEGRPILSIERDGLRMAVLDTPAWLQRPKNIASVLPFVAVLAPPTQRGPELLRSAVKLLSTPQQREQRSGAVLASRLCAASQPEFADVARLGVGKQGWAAHRTIAGENPIQGAGYGWAAALGIDGRTLKLTALLQEQPETPTPPAQLATAGQSAAPQMMRPVWLTKRPLLQEPLSENVGLLVEQIDRGVMEAMPAPLNWLVISSPIPERSSALVSIERQPGPAGTPVYGATVAWVMPQTQSPVDATAASGAPPLNQSPEAARNAVNPELALTATRADAILTEAAARLERFGKADSAGAPPALAQMSLRPEAVRELRLTMDPGTLAGRITGSRTVMSWRAIELAGANGENPMQGANRTIGVVAQLWPAGSSTPAGGQMAKPPLRWILTPLPQLPLIPAASEPPDGAEDAALLTRTPQQLGDDVISQGLLRPAVLSPMIEAPGQTGLADILRTIDMIRWRITTVAGAAAGQIAPPAGLGPRRRIEIELRQAGGKDGNEK